MINPVRPFSRCFVTGAHGFIGTALTNYLSERNIHSISIPTAVLLSPTTSIYTYISSFSPSSTAVLIHLASCGVNKKPSLKSALLSNVVASEHLFRAFIDHGLTKILVTGTCFEYGRSALPNQPVTLNHPLRPACNYSISKVALYHLCEHLSAEYNLDLSYVRLFQVFGPGEPLSRLYPSLVKAIMSGSDFKMSSGLQYRDFTHISAVCKYLYQSLFLLQNFQSFNASSGIATSVLEFASYFWKHYNAKGSLKPGAIESKNLSLSYLVGEPTSNDLLQAPLPFYMYTDTLK